MPKTRKPVQQNLFRPRHRSNPQEKTSRPSRHRNRPNEIVAFFGEGVVCKGKITNHGTVRVDGRFDGEIITKGSLLVGTQGDITAKVRAGTVVSEGRITGDIIAKDKVQLLGTAFVNGSLDTPLLFVEDGAILLTPWTLKMKNTRISARQINPKELKIVESQGVDQEHLCKG